MLGQSVLKAIREFGSIGILISNVLGCCLRGKFRLKVLIQQIYTIGVQSHPVVLVPGILPGAGSEAQTLFQLEIGKMQAMGGAVVAVGMFRELGPVITGLMLAGRVGSAMAAEIGTMKVTEQVDALRSLNVNPVDYLVKPRLQAMIISSPILMLEAVVMGILAAYFVSTVAFDVNQAYWFHFMKGFVSTGDLICSSTKAVVFGSLIAIISCHQGLSTTNGAVGVGQATMKAMVFSAIAILISNFLLTMVLNQIFPMGLMR